MFAKFRIRLVRLRSNNCNARRSPSSARNICDIKRLENLGTKGCRIFRSIKKLGTKKDFLGYSVHQSRILRAGVRRTIRCVVISAVVSADAPGWFDLSDTSSHVLDKLSNPRLGIRRPSTALIRSPIFHIKPASCGERSCCCCCYCCCCCCCY